jgi:8-oxo-dGTP pyrophosphatase MutT (NUDIX family)
MTAFDGRAGRRPDFRLESFLDLLQPHLVDDPSHLPAHPIFGDASLDPDLPPLGRPLRDAAVLVPIVAHRGEAGVILTQRTDHLRAHAGQVAFPGGKVDDDDANAVATALREAEEEIGLVPDRVEPIGCFPPYASNSGFRIVPVIGIVPPGLVFDPNPEEVAEVFEVPLSFLMDGTNHRLSDLFWQGRQRHFWEMPWDGRRIWGVTAGIIRKIFEATYGVGAPPAQIRVEASGATEVVPAPGTPPQAETGEKR